MQDNSQRVRDFIEEALNQGRTEATARYVWEDMVEQVPFPGQGPGTEGLKDVLRGMRGDFPDLHWSVQQQVAQGDQS